MAKTKLKEKKKINKKLIDAYFSVYDFESQIIEHYKDVYP